MKSSYLFAVLLAVSLFSALTAQRFVPLMEQEELHGKRTPAAFSTKVDCGTFDLSPFEVITVGAQRTLRIDLDTVGLGSDLNDYRCDGCDDANFGTVTLRNDTLTYDPRADVEQGLDTLSVQVCSPGGTCSEPVEIIILVQRPGRTIELGNQDLAPGGRTEVVVPDDELPGGASCRTLEFCTDTYGGRSQNANFLLDMKSSNDFFYSASRFAGTDSICVTLCNEFGLCDTYRAAFTINRPAIQLPFFDDFSYTGVRPASDLWQDEDVIINRNYGVLPPSIGVATFDATDFDGQPYLATGNANATVARDYLTSTPIDLRGQNGTVLSFFLQPKGLGNRPERQDSFLVQFLTPTGNWETVFSQEGERNTTSNTNIAPFTGYLVNVQPSYQYEGFQFRFVNKSAERGAIDNWNLDYVKLSNRSTSLITQDLALVEAPFRLIEPYTSMPVRHLQQGGAGLLKDSVFLFLDNHRSDITAVSSSRYEVTIPGQNNFRSGGGLLPSPIFGNDNGIGPDTLEIRRSVFPMASTYSDIANFLLNQIDPALNYTFATIYSLQIDAEDAGFAPGITTNNTATQLTELKDYFAYDDGSAEIAIEGDAGNVVVQRYRAYVDDQLTGVRIRIPRGLGGLGDQNIRFNIYGQGSDSLPGDLLYTFDEPVLFAEDSFADSLQGFTSYPLPEPLEIPAGDFFVGWEQLRADRSIPVGYDRNNEPEGVQFFDTGSGWRTLRGSTRGAIMIRPLMMGAEVNPTSTRDEEYVNFLSISPNPTDGVIRLSATGNVDLSRIGYRLYSLNGAQLAAGSGAQTLDLSAFPAGIYLLECRDGQRVSRHKIVRR